MSENKRTMAPLYEKPVAIHPPPGRMAMIVVLLIFGTPVPLTQAQLSPCTPLQQERGDTSCESPRESSRSLFDTMKGWFGISSEEPTKEGVSELESLPKSSTKNDPYELDRIVKPSQPPISGVRDYLNRQDPARAIYPLEPEASALGKQ